MPDDTPADHEPSGRRMSGAIVAAIAIAIAVPLVLVIVVMSSNRGPEEFHYVVEPGTSVRLAGGEWVETMPAELNVRVGDRLVIENQDDVTHQVGPFTVRAGETLSHTFGTPGVLRDACTLQPEGEIVIRIT